MLGEFDYGGLGNNRKNNPIEGTTDESGVLEVAIAHLNIAGLRLSNVTIGGRAFPISTVTRGT